MMDVKASKDKRISRFRIKGSTRHMKTKKALPPFYHQKNFLEKMDLRLFYFYVTI